MATTNRKNRTNRRSRLVDKHPNLKLIMAPTTVGIAAAAKAMTDEGLCDKVKISGLGLPSEMVSYTMSGCAPQFALWSFKDLGYLTYYLTYLIAGGQLRGCGRRAIHRRTDGRLYHHQRPDTRRMGLHVLMGPFSVYDKTNVEAEASKFKL